MAERRDLLKVIATCAGAGVVGAAVLPAAGLVAQPGREAGSGDGQWYRTVRLEALEHGRPVRANVIGAEVDAWTRAPDRRLGAVWLLREDAQRVRALSVVCPHSGCGIALQGDHFNCPCHDSNFALDGSRRDGPSPRDMDPIEVRVASGWVEVRYQRFRQGIAQRVPA